MLSGKERAAMFLSVLGHDSTERVLDYLPDDVSDAIAKILVKAKKNPSPSDITEILEHYDSFASSAQMHKGEGAEAEEDASTSSPIEVITNASPQRLAEALWDERPEFVAYVLSHLSVEKIYKVLALFGDIRQDVEEKLVHMKDVPIAEVFQEQVLNIVAKRLT